MSYRPISDDAVLVTASGIAWDAENGHTFVAYGDGVSDYQVSHHAACPCDWFAHGPDPCDVMTWSVEDMRGVVG